MSFPAFSSSAQSGLSYLPKDCWVCILEYLSFDDLLSVSKTCKAFHASSEPFLYRKIKWDWVTPPLRRMLQFFRAISNRPDLAASVQYVSLLSSSYPWSDKESRQSSAECFRDWRGPWITPRHTVSWSEERPLFEDVVQEGVDIIHQAKFPDADEWLRALNDGNAYVFATILLSQLPNVKTLYLDYSFVWMGGYPGRMLKHSLLSRNKVLSTFDHLQRAEYGGNTPPAELWDNNMLPLSLDGFPSVYNEDQFIGWFCLPSLQHLGIWLRDTVDLTTNEKLQCNPANLTSLVLARSTIPEEDVLFILQRTPNLTKLHLGLAYSRLKAQVLEKGQILLQALKPFHHTMEVLSLSLEYYPGGWGELHQDDELMESWQPFNGFLKSFTKLQIAEIPIHVLLGFIDDETYDRRLSGVLPSSLQELVIRATPSPLGENPWQDTMIYSNVESFVDIWDVATPLLQRITLRLWNGHYERMWDEDEKALYEACEENDICMNVLADDHCSALWARKIYLEDEVDEATARDVLATCCCGSFHKDK